MTRPVRTFWWRWQYPHRLNFGDEITAPLVERLTGRRVVWAAPQDCDLVGTGSVIQMVVRRRAANQPAIWGGGFISAPRADEARPVLDLRAVRGTLTRARVDSLSPRTVALGDPGLLAPLLLDGTVRKRHVLGVVPHYRDAAHPLVEAFRSLGPGVRVIDVGWTPQEVAREVASCDSVISSSLHGLIFSDALGVPNAHITLGDKLKGGLYKFRDYYSAFPGPDRYRAYVPPGAGTPSLSSVVDAVQEGYVAPVGLTDLQQGLVAGLTDL